MKKIFAIFTVLALLAGGLFAEGEPTNIPRTLTVYGKIGTGLFVFDTQQTSTAKVDLKTEELILPDGVGYKIGYWHLTADNQASAKDYTITYSYGALNAGVENSSIAIELLEVDGDNLGVVKASSATTALSLEAGNNYVERDILFRLTSVGADAVEASPASENYASTVTITLTSD